MMFKVQVTINEEAHSKLQEALKMAAAGFRYGTITLSDMVEEAVLSASFDVERVRHKKASLRKVVLGALKSGTRNVDELIDLLGQFKGLESAPKKERSRRANKRPAGEQP